MNAYSLPKTVYNFFVLIAQTISFYTIDRHRQKTYIQTQTDTDATNEPTQARLLPVYITNFHLLNLCFSMKKYIKNTAVINNAQRKQKANNPNCVKIL